MHGTIVVIVALLLFVSSGASGQMISPDSVPSQYQYMYPETVERGEVDWAGVREALPYVSIEYEVTEYFFDTHADSSCSFEHSTKATRIVKLTIDGPATFDGRGPNREGAFCGIIPTSIFGKLCYSIDVSGFFEMKQRYQAPFTYGTTVVVSVTDKEGQRFSVSEYGSYGPPTFWLLQNTLEWVIERLGWESCN